MQDPYANIRLSKDEKFKNNFFFSKNLDIPCFAFSKTEIYSHKFGATGWA